jgi:hypothetical protein
MRGQEFSMVIINEPEAAVTFALGRENNHEILKMCMTYQADGSSATSLDWQKGSKSVVCSAGSGRFVSLPFADSINLDLYVPNDFS